MIVYFEGVSCSGKTSLLEAVRKIRQDVVVISELPADFQNQKDLDNFCRHNDERKCQAVKLAGKDKIVLVDRGYASTLAYNFIQYKLITSDEYLTTLRWYLEGILTKKLVKPDLYIFLSIDKNTALKRARLLNKLDTGIAWYSDPELGNSFYRFFFSILEPEVPLVEIDGRIPIGQTVKICLKHINKLVHNHAKT